MKPKRNLYQFVACFTSDCCPNPHLWGQAVHAASLEAAKKKFLKSVRGNGREVYEIMLVNGNLMTVEEVEN